jgi:hypothetical protein
MIWSIWKELQFLKATRALADCPPRKFSEAAMKNLRTELRLLTICLWLNVPAGIFVILLGIATRESIGLGAAALELAGPYWRKLVAVVVSFLFVQVIFIRIRLKMCRQLRRLEAMSREWEAEEMRDLTEEGDG